MAYAKILERDCVICGKKAVVEVFNRWNASVGAYCTSHAAQKIRELDQREGYTP